MDRIKTTLVTAFVITLLLTPAAFAQATAANISVVSGNGQLITPGDSSNPSNQVFRPLVVKITDSNGRPISGKTVNWVVSSGGGGVPPVVNSPTTTDSNGISVTTLVLQFSNLSYGSSTQPFLQNSVNASADGVSVTFTETQGLKDQVSGLSFIAVPRIQQPDLGTQFTGAAGSTSSSPIQIGVFSTTGMPAPNVSVRLVSPEVTSSSSGAVILDPTQPNAHCLTNQTGADPGSVLTDATGWAYCYPVFGSTPGTGAIQLLVAGQDPIQFDQTLAAQPLTQPVGYWEFQNPFSIKVTAVAAGRINTISGNNQTVNVGAAAPLPLVAQVTDSSGAVPIAGQGVTWKVSPAGAATVNPASSTTDSNGQAQTTVTLATTASGTVTVTASLTGTSSAIATTFAVNANVQVGAVTKVSGDSQIAQAGQAFSAPLVVQVNSTNGQALANASVSFQVTGGTATLSSGTALTDGNGRAQVTVTAGATAGTVTVSAFIASATQTFTLTIIPLGPSLTTNSFYNAGGLTKINAFSPCSLVTVIATGLASSLQGAVYNTNAFGPWATTLATDTVTVNNVAAPIYRVGKVNGVEQITFQVPCETTTGGNVPVAISVGGGSASVNFPVQGASPGIFETTMSDGTNRAVALRPDGSFVSLQNPARQGEIVRVFVTGMGPVIPSVVTGALPVPGADSLVQGQVIVGVNSAGARVVTSRLSPSLIGVYEVSFQIPTDAPTGNDVILSVAINATGDSTTRYSNGSKLPIQ